MTQIGIGAPVRRWGLGEDLARSIAESQNESRTDQPSQKLKPALNQLSHRLDEGDLSLL